MDACFLCLEINREFADGIQVNSIQWEELKVKHLIEKHLWVMENILHTGWLCNSCWQELDGFHKFYMRIEEAHNDLGPLMKTGREEVLKDQHDSINWELTNNSSNHRTCESHLKSNPIIVHELEKHDISIRPKQNELEDKDNTLTKKIESICISKHLPKYIKTMREDPLKETKVSKRKKKKNEETTIVPNPLQISKMSEVLHYSSDSSESFTDSDCEPLAKFDRCHKKTTNTKATKQRKRDRSKPQAKDLFLAENFKMLCIVCQAPVDTFKNLIKHFELEHKEPGYAFCCNKKFYKRSMLLEHVNRHVDPNYFKCKQCGKILSTSKALKTHQMLHLSEEEKKFSCQECCKNFAEQYLLSNHIRAVHEMKYVKICDICGKTLRCRDIFERHMSEHEGKPIPPINCKMCGLLLSHKKALKRHMDIQHPAGGKQSHTCHICHKISPNIVALKKHIRCTHNTGNIHKCAICERGFKRVQTLRDHVATHTGTALYTCPWCPKTFNSNGCMHAHRKKHHPKEWEEAHRRKYSQKYIPAVTKLENNIIS